MRYTASFLAVVFAICGTLTLADPLPVEKAPTVTDDSPAVLPNSNQTEVPKEMPISEGDRDVKPEYIDVSRKAWIAYTSVCAEAKKTFREALKHADDELAKSLKDLHDDAVSAVREAKVKEAREVSRWKHREALALSSDALRAHCEAKLAAWRAYRKSLLDARSARNAALRANREALRNQNK